ncbi:hypothetical protein ACOMHN_002409 [Nucella lapillus]
MCTAASGGTGLMWSTNCTSLSRAVSRSPVTEPPQRDAVTVGQPGSLIQTEDFQLAERVIECGVLPALSVLGLPANVLNMLVFYRQGLRDKMNLCLFALAFVDFIFLFSMLVTTLYCALFFVSDTLLQQIVQWYIRKYTLNFVYAFLYGSGMLTAIIATERCICVVWPLKSAAFFSTKSMACMILGVIVVTNLLCLPYALRLAVSQDTDDSGNVTVVLRDTDLYLRNKLTFQIVRDTILPSISFLTFLVVSFVTVVTVRKLKTAMAWRQKTSSQVMDRRQMTLVHILVTVSCFYITCSAPNLSLAIVRFLVGGFSPSGHLRNLFFVTHRAGFGLLMVNSSANFLIYYKQSSRFRAELGSVCSCFKDWMKRKPAHDGGTGLV